jgi:hypothetical protein
VDVLDYQPGIGTRRRRRQLGWASATALLLALVATFADQQSRRQEFDHILNRCQVGQSDYVYAERRVAATIEYASPLLQQGPDAAGVQQGLVRLVREAASEGATTMAPDVAAIADLSVLPWHDLQRAARLACQDYLSATSDRLGRVAADLSELDLRPTYAIGTRRAARAALLAAAPDSAATSRVERDFPAAP